MIDRTQLLDDLQGLLRELEQDLLERSDSAEVPEVGRELRTEYERARAAERTAQNYEDWRSDYVTQMAAAWVLSCVFARFLEDNELVDPPKLSGPGERLQRARDEHELYFRAHPAETDREYLLGVFADLARLPGAGEVFGKHNPIHELPKWLSGDAAGDLLRFFQTIVADTGALCHDFSDPAWDTRFLGDLYQDLSEAARKKYALLQTPEFVEEFILDRTLEPALKEFGLDAPPVTNDAGEEITGPGFRMIDPACGSGHFLLGAFPRILDCWRRKDPTAKDRDLVQRTLNSIHGVDINPYAIAIARFRLLLLALRECGILRLKDAPDFQFNLAAGDSLLHGIAFAQQVMTFHDLAHHYHSEDLNVLRGILRPGTYHAVVANPPYITPKDIALNQAYRARYATCHMKYSLAVPFMERIFRLAVQGQVNGKAKPAGFAGQITANSFMKREFGKKLIEEFLPKIDLTHVIDTAGAYIPGHATPTVILFGRHRPPLSGTIRTAMGIRGEPATPDDPGQGLVWTAIRQQIDLPGSESEFISVADLDRGRFASHPWSIGGGGAADLKLQVDAAGETSLGKATASIGPPSFAGIDEMFLAPTSAMARAGIAKELIRPLCVGEQVRDWAILDGDSAFVPYGADQELIQFEGDSCWGRRLWPFRPCSDGMVSFAGQTRRELGEDWWSWYRWIPERYRTTLSIVYGEVVTHNHFVLDHGGKVFTQTAPVIKLPANATEDDYLALLGLLNSSTACFWMKQVCFPKGTTNGDISTEKGRAEANRYAFNATALCQLPIPGWTSDSRRAIIDLAREIGTRAETIIRVLSEARITELVTKSLGSLKSALEADRNLVFIAKAEMVSLQEALDWAVYQAFGLADDDFLRSWEAHEKLMPEARPFRRLDPPEGLGEEACATWQRRRKALDASKSLQLIETVVYKRPWTGRQGVYGTASRTVAEEQRDLVRSWLLDRLESYFDFDGRMNDDSRPTAKVDVALISVAKLADIARADEQFVKVGELCRNDPAFDVQALVDELVAAESVPLLPVLRYKPSGLRKRAEWERTWDLQRAEDAIDARMELPKGDPRYLTDQQAKQLKADQVGDIPVPPKYASADFLAVPGANYWKLRGKLDVPKERWVSFPHCEGEDGTMMIAWAGYDHLQLAQAISAHYVDVQERLGGAADPRLIPLLAGLAELVPWLKQWHNEPDAAFDGLRMGDYFDGFIAEEARKMNLTPDEVKAWQPPARTRGRRRNRA